MVITQASGEDTGGFGIGGLFAHSQGVGQRSKPFEQCDEAFTFAPLTLAKGIAQVLPARLQAVVGNSGLVDGENQVPQR
jgi:hypothetical protein